MWDYQLFYELFLSRTGVWNIFATTKTKISWNIFNNSRYICFTEALYLSSATSLSNRTKQPIKEIINLVARPTTYYITDKAKAKSQLLNNISHIWRKRGRTRKRVPPLRIQTNKHFIKYKLQFNNKKLGTKKWKLF